MAETQHSAASAQEPQAERELTVNLRPYGWRMWEFEGTRAQLEAEGVIPAGMGWLATGAQWVKWEVGPLQFCLRRTRPPGMKGPMRLWVNGDWWRLRCDPLKAPHHLQQRVIDARRALEFEVYRLSPAGQREWDANWQRYWDAREDKAFQAFKLLVPGLVPPKRGRRAGPGSSAASAD